MDDMEMEILPLTPDIIKELRQTVQACSERGLVVASRWASELLLATPSFARKQQADRELQPDPDTSTFPSLHSSTPARPSHNSRASLSFAASSTPFLRSDGSSIDDHDIEAELEADEKDTVLAAKALFDLKEYHRAHKLVAKCESAKAQFIGYYSQYLDSERKALHTWYAADGSRTQPPKPINDALGELSDKLRDASDPWLRLLKGIVLFKMSLRAEALEACILSIKACPWNWSAWSLLIECISDGEEMANLLPLFKLPPGHPMILLFQAECLLQLSYPNMNEALYCKRLLAPDLFPRSLWIRTLYAKILFTLGEHADSEAQFEIIRADDPERIDGLDIYSNLLYLSNNRLKLSNLAHELSKVDKDRPEVCCVVGNHYSLRNEHEKAIKHFRRATHLDRTYVAAWTLLGHEYVEQKNSHAAIEAYRRAVDVSRKDYRAWYGLGQAYELLNMHQYALYYFQQATSMRPYDVRLWQAQGQAFKELNKPREAIECLQHALLYADPLELTTNLKIADIFDQDLHDQRQAALYHQRVVEASTRRGLTVLYFARSAFYVGRFHVMQGGQDWNLARRLLTQVANSNAEETASAADMLKELNKRTELNEHMGSYTPSAQPKSHPWFGV